MSWWDNIYNQSFAGSYGNAARQRAWLKDPNNPYAYEIAADDNGQYGAYDDALRAQQGQAVAGGIISGLTGATTLLSNAFKDAQIRDTSMQENQIADLSRAGNYNYNNYEQLANDYAQTNFNPQFNYQDIRGMTTGQQAGSVATSTLSGAMTGLQIGGPWGALVGGVVGLGTGLGGVLAGNAAAKTKQESLNIQAQLAADTAQQNFDAAHERISANKARQGIVNSVAAGGTINRRSQNIREYADKVLKKSSGYARNRTGQLVRVRKEGGVCVRIKY